MPIKSYCSSVNIFFFSFVSLTCFGWLGCLILETFVLWASFVNFCFALVAFKLSRELLFFKESFYFIFDLIFWWRFERWSKVQSFFLCYLLMAELGRWKEAKMSCSELDSSSELVELIFFSLRTGDKTLDFFLSLSSRSFSIWVIIVWFMVSLLSIDAPNSLFWNLSSSLDLSQMLFDFAFSIFWLSWVSLLLVDKNSFCCLRYLLMLSSSSCYLSLSFSWCSSILYFLSLLALYLGM